MKCKKKMFLVMFQCFSQNYDLASTSLMLCVLILYKTVGPSLKSTPNNRFFRTFSWAILKSTPNNRFFRNFSWAILLILRVFFPQICVSYLSRITGVWNEFKFLNFDCLKILRYMLWIKRDNIKMYLIHYFISKIK